MEKLETVNRRLADIFGRFEDGQPLWRIVLSDDQYENRLTDCSPEGFTLPIPEVRWLPKYKQWIPSKWVLERLVPVPRINNIDLVAKVSYEPVWVFEDKNGNGLPYDWQITEIVIDNVYTQAAKAVGARYQSDPRQGLNTEEQLEQKRIEIKKLQEELFDTSKMADDLLLGQAISVPNKEKM